MYGAQLPVAQNIPVPATEARLESQGRGNALCA
jgi:hypothetical protein